MKAIIVVDEQNDFCEDGALPVAGGNAVCKRTADCIERVSLSDNVIIAASKDWHIEPGEHYAEGDSEPDFVVSFPPHCPAGGAGAAFNAAVDELLNLHAETFYKGMTTAAFSAFEGIKVAPLRKFITLNQWLRAAEVTEIDVVGLALDYCVKATAIDGARLGYKVNVLADLTAPVSQDNVEGVLNEFEERGISYHDA